MGGALLGYQQGVLSEATFAPFVSVSFLAIAFIGGIGQVRGAVLAGIFLATGGLMSAILDSLVNFGPYLDLIGGVAVMASAVAYPNGMAGAPPPPFAVYAGRKIKEAVRGLRTGGEVPVVAPQTVAISPNERVVPHQPQPGSSRRVDL